MGLCLLAWLAIGSHQALAAECTNTWVGPEAGKWTEAENWSAEHVPTEADVVCIPKSNRVTVDSGAQRAEALQGGGELVITEASLALVGVTEPSNIGTLRLKVGGELGGTGELWVVDQFVGLGGLMKGDGYTKIGAEASGEVVGGEFGGQPGLRVTQNRVLSVHGSMGVGGEEGELRLIEGALLTLTGTGTFAVHGSTGKVALRDSADLVNSGNVSVEGPEARISASEKTTVSNHEVLTVAGKEGGLNVTGDAEVLNSGKLTIAGAEGEARINSAKLENSGELTIAGPAGRLLAVEGGLVENEGTLKVNSEAAGSGLLAGIGAVPPHLENTGTVVKTQGTGVSLIEPSIGNEALVKTETGILMLSGGGTSGEGGHSEWVAQSENLYAAGTKLVFAVNSFSLGDEATLAGELQIVSGGGITADGVDGEEGSIWLYGGKLHLLNGGPKVFGELGVAAGTASIDGGSELSADWIEVTGDYLESSGVEELEEPAEVSFGAKSKIQVGAFYQSLGVVQLGDEVTFNGGLINEGGAFEAGDEVVFTGEAFSSEGSFTAGDSTQFLFEEPYTAGTFELGSSSTVQGKYFWQEDGNMTFGAGTSFTDGVVWFADGTATFGEGTTFDLSEILFQERGVSTFGPDVAVHADEWAYFEEGSTSFGPGASLETGTVFIQSELVSLEAGSEVVVDQLELIQGEVAGPGSIVTGKLGWWSTVVSGKGAIEVLDGGELHHSPVCGTPCVYAPEYATLRERELVLRGNFTMDRNTLGMADGAKLVNYGAFDASSEKDKWGPEIQIAPGSSSNPTIVNRGAFEKQTGSGTTVVDVPFRNLGRIGRREGTLDILRPLNLAASERFGPRCHCGDPVETSTGNFSESQTDISVGGLGVGLTLARSYSAQAAAAASSAGAFGYGWTYSFGDRLGFEKEGAGIIVERADGSTVPFASDGEGSFDAPAWSQDTLSGDAETGYTYVDVDLAEWHFSPSGALQSVSDRNGNETTFAYESGRLKTVSDPGGRQLTFAYNGGGQIESAEDPMGHVVHYSYEGKELVSVTMPGEEGPRWQFDYDASHRMTTMTDGRGGETTNEYDADDRVISQTDPAGRALAIDYAGFHTQVTNEATGAVTDTWFNSNNEPTSVTRGYGTADATTEALSYDEAGHLLGRSDGNGHETTYTYNGAGDRTSVTDADENKTEWAYNGTHDVISETTPRGETTTIVRDANGNPETVSRPAPGEATQTTSYDFDSLGQLESLTDPLERTWTYEYDAKGNLEAETDPEGNTRTWGYDENSRVTAIASPRGNAEGAEPSQFTTAIQRDPRGRPETIVDPLGHETEFAYDGNGNLKSETDARGNTTEFTYNADDELIEVEKPNGAVLKTEYDGAGEVVVQIDGNEASTTYVRNVLGQPVEIIDPLNRKTTQEFDAAGNLKEVVDPMERTTAYSYDDADRLTGIDYSDEATPDVSFEYDADGNLTSMVDGSGESSFVYDQLGRLEEATNGHGDTVSYEYDLADQRGKIVYPNGKDVDQAFDAAGRLESVTDWLGGTTSFAYDADSNLEEIQFPAATGNVDEFSYDRAGRAASIDYRKGEESLASLAYERDPLGQVEAIVSEGLPGSEEETFEYDENNRLVKAGPETFEYDGADNPIKTATSANAFDDASQLETGTGVSYAYNQMGERIGETSTSGVPVHALSFGNASSGPGQLLNPQATATDSEGNVWVADTSHNRIQEFNSKGEFVRQFGAKGSEDGQFKEPRGVAVDGSGNVYVADAGNNRVQKFSSKGEYLGKFGTEGTGNGQFNRLQGIAVAPNGHLWTVELGPFGGTPRAQEFTEGGTYLSQFGAKGSEAGQLLSPQGIALDASGNVWIADTGNNRVQAFKASGEFIRKFGSAGSGNGQFSSPKGLAFDAEGKLWVADTANNRLQRFTSEGTYLSQFGTAGPNNGQFSEPAGLAIDGSGNLWVADAGNNRIQVLSATEFIRQFGGESSGPGQLLSPLGTATDSEGNVWVADTSHNRVQEFNSKGEFVRQFGAKGSENGQFKEPRGVAVDGAGNVYVADAGNNRVQKFSAKGEYLAKFGTEGTGNGQFSRLQGVAIAPNGHIWTVEFGAVFVGTPRVQEFSAEGEYLSQFGAKGEGNGQFKEPQAITVDASGNVWVADSGNNRVQAFKASGEFIRKFGSAGSGNGQFQTPKGLAFDAEGKLWVVDSGNNRLQRFSSEGTYLAQFGTAGPNNGQFSEPAGLAIDGSGNLWVADTGNNRVQEASATEFIRAFGNASFGPGQLASPGALAADSEGNVWVADTAHNRIQEFDAKGEFIRQFGVKGSGDGQFKEPKGIAVDSKGNVWVADSGNNRVQKFSSKGEYLAKFGSEGEGNGQFSRLQGIVVASNGHLWTVELGPFGGTPRVQEFSSEGTYLAQFGAKGSENGQFKEPQGVTTDAAGNVWVADSGNNRVQAFKASGEFIRKFGSAGSGNGQLASPKGLAFDAEGNLWIADTANNRLQRFTSEGAYLSQFGTAGPNNGQFSEPAGLAIDGSGDLWIADAGNNRVQEWQWPLAITYSYDQAGNLTALEKSRPEQPPLVSQSFTYDGTGLMASKASGAETQYLAWDPSSPLPLLLEDGVNSYVYGPYGLPITQISAAEEPTYLHHDQLGSTRLLTDASGKTTATFSYSAYGEPAGKTGTATTPLGFAGQYTDADTGLQYLRARFYDPATAQFLTRDPIEHLIGHPYVYALDNPLFFGDPSGMTAAAAAAPACVAGPAACAGAAAAAGAATACAAQAWCRDAAADLADEAGDVIGSLFGDSSDSDEEVVGRLTKAEAEYEEEHNECPQERRWQQDKKVTDRELEEAGLDPHELKRGQKGTDIYKDREGNLYEKPHGGRGPGDPLGINIKDQFR